MQKGVDKFNEVTKNQTEHNNKRDPNNPLVENEDEIQGLWAGLKCANAHINTDFQGFLFLSLSASIVGKGKQREKYGNTNTQIHVLSISCMYRWLVYDTLACGAMENEFYALVASAWGTLKNGERASSSRFKQRVGKGILLQSPAVQW